MRNRKETAYRKSRKFGDAYGGRARLRMTDNIFKRAHSLKTPALDAELPVFLHDNPSRDFFHPVSEADVRAAMKRLQVGIHGTSKLGGAIKAQA